MPEPTALPMTSFSRYQWTILAIACVTTYLQEFTIQELLYPPESEKRGLSPTEYSFVFGTFQFALFAFTILLPKVFEMAEPGTAYWVGSLAGGTSQLAFGFLNKVSGRMLFLGLSISIRTVEALGAALVAVATYTFVSITFSGSTTTVIAILESVSAAGACTSPPVAGFLYYLGGESLGFTLPFLVSGILIYVTALCAIPFLPKKPAESGESASAVNNLGSVSLLKRLPVVVYAFTIFAAFMCSGFLTSTLEPHLRHQFSLLPYEVGLVFMIGEATYAVTATLWGCICDRIPHPEYVTVVGFVSILLSFITIGPASFIPMQASLSLVTVSLGVFGAGRAAVVVSTFPLLLKEASMNGFPDNAATNAACTALWLSSQYFGLFIGPIVGGYLSETVGFRVGTLFLIGLFIIVIIALHILNSVRWLMIMTTPAPATHVIQSIPRK